MKKNLNLNSKLSLRALKNRALRAAALSTVDRATSPKLCAAKAAEKKSSKAKPQLTQFERDIRNICQALRSNAADSMTIEIEQLSEGTSGRWMVSTYRREDFQRQKMEDEEYRRQLQSGIARKELVKPFKARPVVKYVFYPHAVHSDRLGSVAIYGSDASSRKRIIDRMGSFLGHKVARTSLEMGLRLFVDVRFAI